MITNLKPKSRNVRVASIICTNITLEVSRVKLTQWRVQGSREWGGGLKYVLALFLLKIKFHMNLERSERKKITFSVWGLKNHGSASGFQTGS